MQILSHEEKHTDEDYAQFQFEISCDHWRS